MITEQFAFNYVIILYDPVECLTCNAGRDQRFIPGIILGMGSANERRHYIVTSSLIGWAYNQNDPVYPCQISQLSFKALRTLHTQVMIFNPCQLHWIYSKTHKNIFAFSIISPHWEGAGSWIFFVRHNLVYYPAWSISWLLMPWWWRLPRHWQSWHWFSAPRIVQCQHHKG